MSRQSRWIAWRRLCVARASPPFSPGSCEAAPYLAVAQIFGVLLGWQRPNAPVAEPPRDREACYFSCTLPLATCTECAGRNDCATGSHKPTHPILRQYAPAFATEADPEGDASQSHRVSFGFWHAPDALSPVRAACRCRVSGGVTVGCCPNPPCSVHGPRLQLQGRC